MPVKLPENVEFTPTGESPLASSNEIQMALQVNGKVRDQIFVPTSASKGEIEKLAMENEAVLRWTEGKTIRKVIVVPGRLVNIAVS